jgi:hypothetical protein
MSPTPVMPTIQSGDFVFSMSPEIKPMSPDSGFAASQ